VAPTHRRRGMLTSMMRRQLDDLRSANEPLAVLFASEGGYTDATATARDLRRTLCGRQATCPTADTGRSADRTRARLRLRSVRLVELDQAAEASRRLRRLRANPGWLSSIARTGVGRVAGEPERWRARRETPFLRVL